MAKKQKTVPAHPYERYVLVNGKNVWDGILTEMTEMPTATDVECHMSRDGDPETAAVYKLVRVAKRHTTLVYVPVP